MTLLSVVGLNLVSIDDFMAGCGPVRPPCTPNPIPFEDTSRYFGVACQFCDGWESVCNGVGENCDLYHGGLFVPGCVKGRCATTAVATPPNP